MSQNQLEASFECVESGCNSLVDPQMEHLTKLNPTEYSAALATECATCGRLYSVFDGKPILSSDYMKVFLVSQRLEYKQLSAVEKHNLIHEALAALEYTESFEQAENVKRRIVGICGGFDLWNARRTSKAMHAPDCEAIRFRAWHMCNCGLLAAREWFKSHDVALPEE